METAMLNIGLVKISILILFIMCLILIGLVLALAAALWKMRDKLKNEKIKSRHSQIHKHHITNLDDRAEMMHVLENLLETSNDAKVNIALLFVDIDDFNSINSSLGVKFGDLLLQSISDKIVKEVSAFSKLVYHIGSDEFAIVLYDYGTSTESVADIANDIIHAVSQPITAQGYVLQTTCCVGICIYPECSADAEELLKHAGSARDNAKKLGYGSYSFYTQDMSKKSVLRALISADLRHALERNEFVLHYQPKIFLRTGTVQGAEALLRWQHPTLGNITPEIFVPVMEDLGLVHAVGRWVLHTACRDFSKLHKDGYEGLHIAINLSPHQFDKGDIGSIIAEAIWETGIEPNTVELELTEAVVMNDTEKSLLMLKVLQSMGVKIAVDDFGTGYSSMNQLTRFPISILKVDRCFVHDMHLNPANKSIVATIIRMSRQLGFEVVAEGVESEEEIAILREEDCDIIQGFYYSKGLSLAEFTKFVDENKTMHLNNDRTEEHRA